MMDLTKQVIVYRGTGGSNDFPSGYTVPEMIVWLGSFQEEIPEEFQANTKVSFGVEYCGEDSYPTIEISYTRPMTDAEIASVELGKQRIRTLNEQHDRAKYAELHARFGLSSLDNAAPTA